MEDSKLGLAFTFEDAPQEIKDAAAIHKENFLAYAKAKKQLKMWARQLDKAKKDYMKSGSDFDRVLKAWDPFQIKAIKIEETGTP